MRASFTGECGGKCDGTCNGEYSLGKCAGTCDGSCDAFSYGSCGARCYGTCSASCTIKGRSKCNGTCSGDCSVELKGARCSGEMKLPGMSAECKANCDAKVSGKIVCVPAQVAVKVEGALDASAAGKLRAAIQVNLPAILKVTLGMKTRLEGAMTEVKGSLERVWAAIQGDRHAALKVAVCLAASLKGEAEASYSLSRSLEVSASASAEAGAE